MREAERVKQGRGREIVEQEKSEGERIERKEREEREEIERE